MNMLIWCSHRFLLWTCPWPWISKVKYWFLISIQLNTIGGPQMWPSVLTLTLNFLYVWLLIFLAKTVWFRARHSGMSACPGHADLVPGHINFCGYMSDWASDFSVWSCTYFPSSLHKFYRACTNIGWACENFCKAHKFKKKCAQWACKPNA